LTCRTGHACGRCGESPAADSGPAGGMAAGKSARRRWHVEGDRCWLKRFQEVRCRSLCRQAPTTGGGRWPACCSSTLRPRAGSRRPT
jgi:hypothetical protein